MITKELEVELRQTVFWTDSTTVLRYTENRSRRFSVLIVCPLFMPILRFSMALR